MSTKPVELERKSTLELMPVVEEKLHVVAKRTLVNSVWPKLNGVLAYAGLLPGVNAVVSIFEMTLVGSLSFNILLESVKNGDPKIRNLSDTELQQAYLKAIRRKDEIDSRVKAHAEHLTIAKTTLEENYAFLTKQTQKMSDRYEQMSINDKATMSERSEYLAPKLGDLENAKAMEKFFDNNYRTLQQIDAAESTLYASFLRELRNMKEQFNETPAQQETAGRELAPEVMRVKSPTARRKKSQQEVNREILEKISIKIGEVKMNTSINFSQIKKDLDNDYDIESTNLAQMQYQANEGIRKFEKEYFFRVEKRELQLHGALALFRLSFIGSSIAFAYYHREKTLLDRYETELRGKDTSEADRKKIALAKTSSTTNESPKKMDIRSSKKKAKIKIKV